MAKSTGSVRSLIVGFAALALLIFLGVYAFDEFLASKIAMNEVVAQSIRVLIVAATTIAAIAFIRSGKQMLVNRAGIQITSAFEFILVALVLILATFSVLHIFNVDTNTLLISGGIISITVGLVVSTFVGDTLAGMLVFALNLYKIGDLVLVNSVPARVEEMSAFVTRFRNDAGGVISIPNTAISQGSIMITRFKDDHIGGVVNRLPYMKGDRVYTTYLNAEGVVEELNPVHTRIRLDNGMEITFMNNSVLSGTVAVAKVTKSE